MPYPRTKNVVLARTMQALEECNGNKHAASNLLGISRASIRTHARLAAKRKLDWRAELENENQAGLTASAAELRRAKVFVITSAQNDTGLHLPFWRALQRYCATRMAQMLVIPCHYKNLDAFHQGADVDYVWPAEVAPYLLDRDIALSPGLMVMGDVKINATAVNPLAGMEPLSGIKSAIYGHAQVQMRMVATPANALPKMLHTTGSVSKKNYSRTRDGKKAAFHHTVGALVVEISGSRFWTREIHCDDQGGFYDLNTYYTAESATTGHRAEAVILGDEHVKFADPAVQRATFGKSGIVETLQPKVLVRHDIHDHYSQSHHHEHDTILKVQKAHAGDWSVLDELKLTRQHLIDTTPPGSENWIIESNHHDHLYKWINRFDANKDPHNAVFAWELKGYIAQAIKAGEDADPFRLFLRHTLPPDLLQRVRFVGANDDRAIIAGIDLSQHGDRGPNGTRPSPAGFAKSTYKMFTGHTHTPGIEKGCYTVGTSTRRMGYVKGLSSWMITHGVIYPNGKRALLHIVDGDWRRA